MLLINTKAVKYILPGTFSLGCVYAVVQLGTEYCAQQEFLKWIVTK